MLVDNKNMICDIWSCLALQYLASNSGKLYTAIIQKLDSAESWLEYVLQSFIQALNSPNKLIRYEVRYNTMEQDNILGYCCYRTGNLLYCTTFGVKLSLWWEWQLQMSYLDWKSYYFRFEDWTNELHCLNTYLNKLMFCNNFDDRPLFWFCDHVLILIIKIMHIILALKKWALNSSWLKIAAWFPCLIAKCLVDTIWDNTGSPRLSRSTHLCTKIYFWSCPHIQAHFLLLSQCTESVRRLSLSHSYI